MKLDLGTTSLVAALCSTPFAAKLLFVKEKNRPFAGVLGRSHFPETFKWMKKHNTAATQTESPTLTESHGLSIPNPHSLTGLQKFFTGALITGVAVFLLNIAEVPSLWRPKSSPPAKYDFKDCAPWTDPVISEVYQLAAVNKVSAIEENAKQKLRNLEIRVDQLVGDIQEENSTMTKEDLDNKQQMIKEVWETVNLHYYNTRDPNFSKEKWAKLGDEALLKQPKTKHSTYKIIRNMLDKGLNDSYARITPQEEFSKMQKYDMTGVGLNVGSVEDFVQRKLYPKLPENMKRQEDGIWVLGLIKGSVSDVAGVQIGDQILEVDGVSVSGSSPFQTAHMIKGTPSQPKVVLKIRKKEGDFKEVKLNRSTTKAAASVKMSIERVVGWRKVGRIQVLSCTAQARDEVLEALQDLQMKNIKEVILDLRENRGGLVQEGVEIAKLFLDQGSTVMISQLSSDHRDSRYISNEPPSSNARLIIQVGPETASAAEIIAGALKDNCRGVVVGERTYGKGLIQSVYALSDGSGLTLTVGQYLTPNMINIDQRGIETDFRRIPKRKLADEALHTCRVERKQSLSRMGK